MPTSGSDSLEDLLRLQIMLLRREAPTQKDLILEMTRGGFAPARIADLLSINVNTVTSALSKAKSAKPS